MKTTIALATLLLLAPVAHAQTRTASKEQSLGNQRWGTAVRRSVVASHGSSGRFDCSTSLHARLAGRSYRAAEVSRNAEGQSLGQRPRAFDRSKLTVASGTSFTIGLTFTHSFSIVRYETPVFVGPFVFNIQGQAGLTLELRGFVGVQGRDVVVGREGSASIGGTLGVGIGPPARRSASRGSSTS
jgi:hypothetical protein